MTSLKTGTQLIIALTTLALPGTLLAEDSVKNEYKSNGTGNAVSNADLSGHVNSGFSFAVNEHAKATARNQQKIANNVRTFKQMEQRRRQMQQAQLEAFKRQMQERRQQQANNRNGGYALPEDVQTRRKEYIKLMDERRTLMKKMMDERRQESEERRRSMLLKMHQTSTTPMPENKELANKA